MKFRPSKHYDSLVKQAEALHTLLICSEITNDELEKKIKELEIDIDELTPHQVYFPDEISASFKNGWREFTNNIAYGIAEEGLTSIEIPETGDYNLNTDVGLCIDGVPMRNLNKKVAQFGIATWCFYAEMGSVITFLAPSATFSIHKIK